MIHLVAYGGEGEVVRGVALLEIGLDDSHRNVLDNGSGGADGRGARTHARQHQCVPTHESLEHQILRLLPDI